MGRKTVLLTGAVWFITSALLSTYANTAFILYFQSPTLHTFVRFFGSALLGYIIMAAKKEAATGPELVTLVKNLLVPAGLLFLANYANSIALQFVGITLTYVCKACIPVFTVIVCTLGGQKFPLPIYLSLLPITIGVALASGSDLNFNIPGLIAAMTSSLGQTLMNVTVKKIRDKYGYSGPEAFTAMSMVATILCIPCIFCDPLGPSTSQESSVGTPVGILTGIATDTANGNIWPVTLACIATFAYFLEYSLNFIFVGFVSSVTFSVCDIGRRIGTITAGSIFFAKPLTTNNIIGIAIALGGVFLYSYLDNIYNTGNKQKEDTNSKIKQS